jgi:hypothetical protein
MAKVIRKSHSQYELMRFTARDRYCAMLGMRDV